LILKTTSRIVNPYVSALINSACKLDKVCFHIAVGGAVFEKCKYLDIDDTDLYCTAMVQ